MKIQPDVVSVIEINGDTGLVSSLRVWMDNKAGREAAREMFRDICSECTDLTDEQIVEAVNRGYAEYPGGGTVQLVTSNNQF